MADPVAQTEAVARQYSGVERAAVLMMLVGDDEAAAILQKLDPEEVRQLGKAMFAVADVSENEVEDVLDDFVDRARERTAIGFDPRPRIEGMMTRALGAEKAESVLARTRTARLPAPMRRMAFSETSTAAADPSVFGQHCIRVSGSAIIGEASTSSSVTSLRKWANGLCWESLRLFTDTLASSSRLRPCSAMWRDACIAYQLGKVRPASNIHCPFGSSSGPLPMLDSVSVPNASATSHSPALIQA